MYIGIDYLKEGMVVDEAVFLGNAILIPAGKVLTEPLIDSVKKHRDKIRDDSLKVSLTKEQMLKYEQEEKWRHNMVDSTISRAKKREITESLKQVMVSSDKPITLVQKAAKEITNLLYWSKFKTINETTKEKAWILDFNYDLADYGKQYDIYEHSLRVSQFAVVVAAKYNEMLEKKGIWNKSEMIQLDKIATAALLHDYGIRYQDPDAMKLLSNYRLSEHLINKYNLDKDLLKEEYNEKYAPIYAFASLPLDNTITNIILYSDENDNGTGPLGVKYSEINTTTPIRKAAGIVHLCSFYDDILVRAIQNGLNNQDMNLENVSAVFQYAAKNKLIDNDLKNIFESTIPLYSVGTRVQLSDDRYGIVIDRGKESNFNARPTIITTDKEVIDLSNGHFNLTIKRIVTEKEDLIDLVNNIAENQLMEEAGIINNTDIKIR